ncbi:MAG: UpxY family transcription antiterminator [Terriglobales bacterium]|jgi:transcriptional antiterminator NusG
MFIVPSPTARPGTADALWAGEIAANQTNWYAAYTYPRHEKKVNEHLALREIESFLPCYRARHKWRNGCTVDVHLPLFAGYVFVRTNPCEQLRVLQVPGLVHLISFGGVPAPVSAEEIETLKTVLSAANAEPHPVVAVGDRVRIKSGCLAGIEGILLRKTTGFRLVLNVDLIRQAAAIEVSADDVEPVALLPRPRAAFPHHQHC